MNAVLETIAPASVTSYISSDVPASEQKNVIFRTIYAQLRYSLPYNEMWEGENLDDMILGNNEDMPIIPIGKMSKGESEDGRRFIFIGTRLGTVVVAETNKFHSYSFPKNRFFDLMFYKDSIGLPDHKHLLGWGTNKNVGMVIEEMAELLDIN